MALTPTSPSEPGPEFDFSRIRTWGGRWYGTRCRLRAVLSTNAKTQEAELEWAIGQLAALIAREGAERFLWAPLLLPNPESFPDAWNGDALSVALVLRRSLEYIGEEAPHVLLFDHTPLTDESDVALSDIEFVEVGEEGDFVFELSVIGGSTDFFGILGHELGRAFIASCEWRQAKVAYRASPMVEDEEDRAAARGSIAAIYLGLGIPAANATHQAKHSGHFTGSHVITEWSTGRAGGLTSPIFVYLLALQSAVRNRKEEHELARKQLAPNQRKEFLKVLDTLMPKREAWIKRLRLPKESTWTSLQWPVQPPAKVAPGSHEIEVPVDEKQAQRYNEGLPVFRVTRHMRTVYGGFGLVIGAVLGLATLLLLGPSIGLGAPVVGLLVGAVIGRRTIFYQCSDSGCEIAISPSESQCPGCAGRIVGELTNASERLNALEELRESGELEDDDEFDGEWRNDE